MVVEELQSPGERLRWLRLANDLTQAALGDRALVSQRMISHFEADRHIPRQRTRQKLAEALGVHPDFIWRPADLAKRKRVAA